MNCNLNHLQQLKRVFSNSKKYITQGWTQQYYAKDRNNERVNFASKKAAQFCVLGALQRSVVEELVVQPINDTIFLEPLFIYSRKILEEISGVTSLTSWNDYDFRLQEEVIELFQKAEEKIDDKIMGAKVLKKE